MTEFDVEFFTNMQARCQRELERRAPEERHALLNSPRAIKPKAQRDVAKLWDDVVESCNRRRGFPDG